MAFLMQICIFNIQRAPENLILNFHTYINEYFFQNLTSKTFLSVRLYLVPPLDCTFIF